MLLGSVANHAWAEDSLYFRLGRGGDIVCEQESKNAPVPGFKVTGIRNRRWEPLVIVNRDDAPTEPDGADGRVRKAEGSDSKQSSGRGSRVNAALKALSELPAGQPHKIKLIAENAGVAVQSAYAGLKRAMDKGWVEKVGTEFRMTDEGLEAVA